MPNISMVPECLRYKKAWRAHEGPPCAGSAGYFISEHFDSAGVVKA